MLFHPQGAPLRRGHLSQKSAMKRKRSFKRQKSQAGRGKPETLLQGNYNYYFIKTLLVDGISNKCTYDKEI